MTYRPIEEHGLIGDMHTAALVGIDGCIDWLCLPHFDSPSVFCAILDDKKGGSWQIHPLEEDRTTRQFYWPETNVLVTRFFTHDGAAELTDFMPVGSAQKKTKNHEVIRIVKAVRGTIKMEMTCEPAFDFAREPHKTTVGERGARFEAKSHQLGLATEIPLTRHNNGVRAEFELFEGQTAVFVLRLLDDEGGYGEALSTQHAELAFERTVAYWHHWMSRCKYQGRWREMVHRSLLTLKLLTFDPTGAIVAAPTMSLPEGIGGERNWDYRYTWIRDTAFTLYSFLRMGYDDEAEHFVQFLRSLPECDPGGETGPLQIMYGIDGRLKLSEHTLEHLDGYMASRPVRVGNGAYDQLQLDIYGELIDALYLYDKWGTPISHDTWVSIRSYADWVCENWLKEDEGIWEVRGGRRHFVYSKLMCWVALDRTLRIQRRRSLPCDVQRLSRVRNQIYDWILTKGWNEARQAFVMSEGSDALDAANLMMSLTLFMAPSDPRMLSTLEAMMKPPHEGGLLSNSLVFRYNVDEASDGLDGEEGTFNICTFWLVEALTRAGHYKPELLDKARLIFERMLGFANHLGLYAEETGPRGEGLGNFPQAFTHLAIISSAFNLDKALGAGA